ncbi:MAG TPA: tautomerase family protein [Thermoclostridium sp.]|nr:4-oxalocrotonate tautomerase [Clostridiaceae bacterium]HOQ76772.1 tautomerase family protein [Thermoclostridium sp.]
MYSYSKYELSGRMRNMPHVVVKMYPGRTQEQKEKMAEKITEALLETIGCEEKSISIAVEEVTPEEWNQRVYQPEIMGKAYTLLKKPGYVPKNT